MLHRKEDIIMTDHSRNQKYDALAAEFARQLKNEDDVLKTAGEFCVGSFPPSGEKAGTVGGE
jgi:hypothetical protein